MAAVGRETLGARAAENMAAGRWGSVRGSVRKRHSIREMMINAAKTATQASYKETKEYLIAHGYKTQEVLDAPTTFHLRNIATQHGIDLAPLESKYSEAASAVLAALKEKEEALAREEEAEEEERKANAAAAAAEEAAEDARIAAAAKASRRSVSEYLTWIEEGDAQQEVERRQSAQVDISEVSEAIQQGALQAQLREEADAVEKALTEAEAAAAAKQEAVREAEAAAAAKQEAEKAAAAAKQEAERKAEEAKLAAEAEAEARAIKAAQDAAQREAEAMDAAKEAAARQVVAVAAAEVERTKELEREEAALEEAKNTEVAAIEAARAAAERQAAARAAAAEIRKLAAERAKDAEQAEAALADAQDSLERERAALFIQAMVRRWQQSSVFFHAWSSVVTLQKRFRSRLVRSVFRRIRQYLAILKEGALFLQVSADGTPPQEKFVWLDEDLKTLCWSTPAKSKSALDAMLTPKEPTDNLELVRAESRRRSGSKGSRKAQDRLLLSDCQAVTQGEFSDMTAAKSPSRENVRQKLLNSFKGSSKKLNLEPNRCLSIADSSRTLALVAPSQRMRDDWMWALRMMASHWTIESSFQGIRGQRQMMGIDDELCRNVKIRAIDVLGAEYCGLELEVVRSAHGMGVVLDAACNMVVELTPDGAGKTAGLETHDVIMFVDGTAVTAIENGYIVPISLVVSAINPTKDKIHLTVFRTYRGPPLDE